MLSRPISTICVISNNMHIPDGRPPAAAAAAVWEDAPAAMTLSTRGGAPDDIMASLQGCSPSHSGKFYSYAVIICFQL